jgi:hypothetical protein
MTYLSPDSPIYMLFGATALASAFQAFVTAVPLLVAAAAAVIGLRSWRR